MITTRSEKDVQAFHDLMDKYREPLTRYIKKTMGRSDLEEDVLQEVFTSAWESFHKAHGKETMRAWIFVIAANACKKVRRETFANTRRLKDLHQENRALINAFYESQQPDKIVMDKEQLHGMLNALDSLPAKLQIIFHDRYVEDKSALEIASEHKMSKRAVNKALAKIRRIVSDKTRNFLIAFLAFRLLHSGNTNAWDNTSARFQVADSLSNITPAAVETVADNAPQATETATVSAGTAASVVGSMATSVLMATVMPFLWLMSALIGGQVCGLAFVYNAPTIQIRRWLVRQLFYCYCGITAFFVYFLSIQSLILTKLEWQHDTHRMTFLACLVIFMLGMAYCHRTRKTYQKIRNDTRLFFFCTATQLSRFIHRGFIITSIVLVLALLPFLITIVITDYQNNLNMQQSDKNLFIITFFMATGCVWLYTHVSMFFLFRYFIAISQDSPATPSIRIPRMMAYFPGAHSVLRESAYIMAFAVLTLAPSLLHLVLVNTRPFGAAAELVCFSLCWLGILVGNTKRPQYRWYLIIPAFIVIVLMMIVLRSAIYE